MPVGGMYTEQEAALVAAAQLRAQEHHRQYDPSHDFYHVDRVRRLALAIARSCTQAVDLVVVELAALFHDLIDAKYLPKQAPKPTARQTLDPFWSRHDDDRQILDEERRRLVERIVDNVSYSKEVKRIAAGHQTEWHLSCLELHCVQDADKLDAIGAFGIMRCSAYSAIANRPLFVPAPPPPPASLAATTATATATATATNGTPGNPSAVEEHCALDHFHAKLFKLEGMMKTGRGRELATRRTETMRRFVDDAEREWAEAVGGGVDSGEQRREL